MTDQADRLAGHTAVFTVSPTAIPVGIRCRTCDRHHLPARLWPLAIRPRPGGGTEIDLHCVRCNTTGPLLLDEHDPHHHALLAMWRDQTGGRPGGNDDPKAPA